MSTMTTEAIRKTVLVDFAPAEAFELFTDARSPPGGRSGRTRTAATPSRTSCSSPRSAAGSTRSPTTASRTGAACSSGIRRTGSLLDWQIGEARGTEVEVRFSPEGPGARVELEHRGFSSGAIRATRYSGGWDVVLAPFVESARR